MQFIKKNKTVFLVFLNSGSSLKANFQAVQSVSAAVGNHLRSNVLLCC